MFNSFERHKWLEPSIFKLEEDLKKIDIEFDFRLVGSEYDLGFILEYKYLILVHLYYSTLTKYCWISLPRYSIKTFLPNIL